MYLSPQTNTFQCVLATNGTKSYVIFLYADLQWAAPNQCNGNGVCTPIANPAQAGFSAGDGMRYFGVNGSGTDAVVSLNSTSNVGLPGVWIFQVDGDQVLSAGKPVIACSCSCFNKALCITHFFLLSHSLLQEFDLFSLDFSPKMA